MESRTSKLGVDLEVLEVEGVDSDDDDDLAFSPHRSPHPSHSHKNKTKDIARCLSSAAQQRCPRVPASDSEGSNVDLTGGTSPLKAASGRFWIAPSVLPTRPISPTDKRPLGTLRLCRESIPEEFQQEPNETEGEWTGCTKKFLSPIQITSRGAEILNNPLFNKATAFKGGERDRLRFRGLLPPRRMNMQLQKDKVLEEIRSAETMIQKHLILEDVHDYNETLYHRILVDHMEEMAPIIYTPTVGQACNEFAMRYRRPRGMYFCGELSGRKGNSEQRTRAKEEDSQPTITSASKQRPIAVTWRLWCTIGRRRT